MDKTDIMFKNVKSRCGNMAIKFRNSLFGFNKDDVLEYVVAAKGTENTLKTKLEKLEKELDNANKTNSELTAENASLSSTISEIAAELENYHKREEQLTKLSESIGKMYLVSQSNARTVLNSVNDSVKKAEDVITAKIDAANKAEEEFTAIRQILNEKTESFNNEVLELQDKLYRTKVSLKENAETVKEATENIEELVTVSESE